MAVPEPVATDPRTSPSAVAERIAEREHWAGLLATLPPAYRAAVVLRHVDGLSYPELALALERPEGTVKAQVHRGLAMLRTALEFGGSPRAPGDDRMTTDDRTLEAAMADLATTAPSTLAPDVLVEVGLADRMARLDSVIGPLYVAWNGLGVSAVESAEFAATHAVRTGRPVYVADALPDALARAIDRRLGGDKRVRIDLDLRGHSDFERDVWRKALDIPRGEVRPYGWIAAEIGRPRAVRAVGTALGHNPVPLIVPCHRVVRTDGTIGQYSLGGPENKRRILASEGLDPDDMESLARSGIRFIGSDTTQVVCLPTCYHAKRIGDAHRVAFRSMGRAAAAGYRPCLDCRPASGAGALAA